MKDFKFNLGDEVQDLITKFKGIVRARSDYLTGCNRYGVQSSNPIKNDNTITDWYWFDEEQLKLIKADKINLDKPKKKNGGPQNSNQIPPV